MSYDIPARTIDYRGHVMRKDADQTVVLPGLLPGENTRKLRYEQVQAMLDALGRTWPPGTEVEWLYRGMPTGITGRVRLDEPVSIPGIHLGKPAAVCLDTFGEKVCARWDTGLGRMCPHLAWVPIHQVRRASKGRRS